MIPRALTIGADEELHVLLPAANVRSEVFTTIPAHHPSMNVADILKGQGTRHGLDAASRRTERPQHLLPRRVIFSRPEKGRMPVNKRKEVDQSTRGHIVRSRRI